MPHTWIVWVYAQTVHSHIAIQEMSAVRLIPWSRKLPHFQQGQSENTFVKYVRRKSSTDSHYFDITNLRNFSETNNTLRGHCSCRIQKITLRKLAKGEKVLYIGWGYSSWSNLSTSTSVIWP